MKIEILHIDACPSWKEAGERLEQVLAEKNISATVRYELITEMSQLNGRPFYGSPTILVDDVDLFSAGKFSDELSCRVFQTPEGLRGVPTKVQLTEAVSARMVQ